MKNSSSLIEWKGGALALCILLFSLIFFYRYSSDFYYSVIGAVFSALLVWGSYLIIRMMMLAGRE